jgi:ribosomal protein S18 acetylase RimI-like enzyme
VTEAELELRLATPADAPAIGDIWLTSFKATYSFPPAYPDDAVLRWIGDELMTRDEVWVATDADGIVVGFMALGADDLDQLYVRSDRFDRGIGSRLLDLAKERRPRGLGLYTFQENARARAFYERRGFSVAWLGNGEHNEERQPDVRYVWMPPR